MIADSPVRGNSYRLELARAWIDSDCDHCDSPQPDFNAAYLLNVRWADGERLLALCAECFHQVVGLRLTDEGALVEVSPREWARLRRSFAGFAPWRERLSTEPLIDCLRRLFGKGRL